MKGFTVEAQLTGCRPLADRGMSINFHTKELDSTEKALIIDHLLQYGWMLFKENELKDEDIPKNDAEFDTKTPSQRLRGVIFKFWEQEGKNGDFDMYYRGVIEKFINLVKTKLL